MLYGFLTATVLIFLNKNINSGGKNSVFIYNRNKIFVLNFIKIRLSFLANVGGEEKKIGGCARTDLEK